MNSIWRGLRFGYNASLVIAQKFQNKHDFSLYVVLQNFVNAIYMCHSIAIYWSQVWWWFWSCKDKSRRLIILFSLIIFIYITRVLWKKKCGMLFLPWKYFFYTFWILVDKMLIGTMRPRNNMSFWQIGPGKRKTWYLFSIPTWGLFQTSELAGWAQVTIKNSQIPWQHYNVTKGWGASFLGV